MEGCAPDAINFGAMAEEDDEGGDNNNNIMMMLPPYGRDDSFLSTYEQQWTSPW